MTKFRKIMKAYNLISKGQRYVSKYYVCEEILLNSLRRFDKATANSAVNYMFNIGLNAHQIEEGFSKVVRLKIINKDLLDTDIKKETEFRFNGIDLKTMRSNMNCFDWWMEDVLRE